MAFKVRERPELVVEGARAFSYDRPMMTRLAPDLSPAAPPLSLGRKLAVFASDIKIHHSIFAMPFALLSTVMASRIRPDHLLQKIGLIVVCMVTARTVAMAANRLLDARLDALNPRTARRAIPSGALSRGFVLGAMLLCGLIFILGTALFWFVDRNPWPVVLAVPVLAFLGCYPLLKRFTHLCHYYLGAALALAPVCAWVAVSGHLNPPPLFMFGAVLLWTAGFDIIYACQDYHSDLETGVVSVPARIGISKALWVARLTHVACVGMLIGVGLSSPLLHWLYFTGVGIAAVLLIAEHSVVKANDLSKLTLAFFTLNGIISLLLGTLGIVDVLVYSGS